LRAEGYGAAVYAASEGVGEGGADTSSGVGRGGEGVSASAIDLSGQRESSAGRRSASGDTRVGGRAGSVKRIASGSCRSVVNGSLKIRERGLVVSGSGAGADDYFTCRRSRAESGNQLVGLAGDVDGVACDRGNASGGRAISSSYVGRRYLRVPASARIF